MKVSFYLSDVKELDGFVRQADASITAKYQIGMGEKIFKDSPDAFKKMVVQVLNKLKATQPVNDQEKHRIQLQLIKDVRKELELLKQRQQERATELVKAFQKLEPKPLELSEQNKLFKDIQGSAAQQLSKKEKENAGKIKGLQEEIAKQGQGQVPNQNLLRFIDTLTKQRSDIEKEGQELEPDQSSINKAYLQASELGDEKLLSALNKFGFKPGDGIRHDVSRALVNDGSLGTETVKFGKDIGLRGTIEQDIADSQKGLFTDSEKYENLTDKAVANETTVVDTRKEQAYSTREDLVIEKTYGSVFEEMEAIASAKGYKISKADITQAPTDRHSKSTHMDKEVG